MAARSPFVIRAGMFAVKRDGKPHLIVYPENGTHPILSPEALDAWALLFAEQSDAVRDSAIGASMFGWDAPVALAALTEMAQRAKYPAKVVTAAKRSDA